MIDRKQLRIKIENVQYKGSNNNNPKDTTVGNSNTNKDNDSNSESTKAEGEESSEYQQLGRAYICANTECLSTAFSNMSKSRRIVSFPKFAGVITLPKDVQDRNDNLPPIQGVEYINQ